MAIKVFERKYENLYDSEVRDWLLGNNGSWVKATIAIICGADFLSERDGVVVYDSLLNTLTLNNGREWRQYGLFEDASHFLRIKTFKTLNGVTTEQSTILVQITLIDGALMVLDTPLVLPQSQFPSVQVEGSDAATWHITLSYKIDVGETSNVPVDQVNVKYNLVENSTIDGGNINSIIDGTIFEATALNLIGLGIGVPTEMEIISVPSGMAVKTIFINKVNPIYFEIEITYMIHGFFTSGNNFLNGVTPTYFEGDQNLGDNMEFQAFFESNNPNITLDVEEFSTIQGNTGYFEENFNGLPNNFSIENLIMVNELGQFQEDLSFNAKTKLTFSVSKEGLTDWDGLKVQIGFFRAARQISEISNNENSFLENAFVSNCYKGSGNGVFVVGTNTNEIFEGWGVGTAEMKIINPKFITLDQKLNAEIEFSPNTEFANFIEGKNENDRIYGIWVSVAGSTDDLNISDRVPLIVSKGQMQTGVSLAGEYEHLNIRLVEHPFISGQNDMQTAYALPNDDLSATINIWKDSTKEVSFIEVSYAIEAERNDGVRFTLQKNDLDVAQSIVVDGIQQINTVTSRNFKYAIGNEKNVVSLSRAESIDQGDLIAYKGLYGFKNRWESWKPLVGAHEDFYDINLPNNGLNHEWFRYSDHENWNVFFVVYVRAIIDGEELLFRNTLKYFIADYFDNPNIDATYVFRNADTGQPLSGGLDTITGKSLGVILTNVNTEFEIRYKLLSGIWEQSVVDTLYATASIDPDQGAGELSERMISSVVPQEAGNPLEAVGASLLTMEIDVDTTVLIVKFQVNPFNLDPAAKYRFTGRLGCKGDPEVLEGQYNSQYNTQYN